MTGLIHTLEENGEENWIGFSDLNHLYYSSLLSTFSLISSFCVQPLVVLTIRQQALSSTATSSLSTLEYFKVAYKEIGYKGLYRGYLPLAIMGIPSTVVYGLGFEISRETSRKILLQTNPNIPSSHLECYTALFSSLFSNALSLICYTPAEVISSRMIIQSKEGLSMLSMIQNIRSNSSHNLLSGFYRGYSSSLLTGVISSSVWWSAYSIYRNNSTINSVPILSKYPIALDASGGFIAGIISIFFSHPFDTIKTRIMTGVSKEKSIYKVLYHQAVNGKLVGLWKGFFPNLYQASIASAGFAIVYEMIKRESS
jgi:Mitochondrial carrier protein